MMLAKTHSTRRLLINCQARCLLQEEKRFQRKIKSTAMGGTSTDPNGNPKTDTSFSVYADEELEQKLKEIEDEESVQI